MSRLTIVQSEGGRAVLGRRSDRKQPLLSQRRERVEGGGAPPPFPLLLLLLRLTSLAGDGSDLAPKRMVAMKVCLGTPKTLRTSST